MPKNNSGGINGEAGSPFTLPSDLTALTSEQLDELRAAADAEFDAIYDAEGGPRVDQLERATELASAIQAINTRKSEIEAEAAETAAKFQELRNATRPTDTAEQAAPEDGSAPQSEAVATNPADPSPQLVTAAKSGGAVTASRELGGLSGPKHRINPSLSGAQSVAPAQTLPGQELAITASVGLPGQFEAGARLRDLRQVGTLMEQRARSMGDQGGRYAVRRPGDPYGGVQVASIANDYATVLSDTSPSDVVQAYIERLATQRSAGQFEAMVAGGGWCAPSQNRYDFFNIACEGGMIDLPTFGVERGGVNFPVSPSLADTFSPAIPWYTAFSNATVPWLWTETDDILTVTGSTNKPCIRVPCSSMTNVRLECYGICLTAGNLADNAWPESTRNFLRLLMAAHYHAQNARYIQAIVTAAGTEITGCTPAGSGTVAPILGTAELGAWDYRTRYGMCDTDVLEFVLPAWSKGAVRQDLSKRTGVSDFMCVTDAQIAAWFDCRNLRVQFVDDWQVRAANQPGAATAITGWPTLVNGLLYAAGTVARGNGMSLDLGVVRDSTLNAENDFTAAWMEECHLIAQFGHQVRNYRINICPDGTTGAADLTSCCP